MSRFEYEVTQEQWWEEQDKDQEWIDQVNQLISEALQNEHIEDDRRNRAYREER